MKIATSSSTIYLENPGKKKSIGRFLLKFRPQPLSNAKSINRILVDDLIDVAKCATVAIGDVDTAENELFKVC